jgi:hypothetical protein
MKHKSIFVVVILVLCVALVGTAAAQANTPNAPDAVVGTAFTYQSQIKRNGALFTGTCDMQFKLWDDPAAGTQQGSTLSVNAVNVDTGIFTVELDFGNQFKGAARWLETSAKCADDADFTTMPRVALNPTPYAIGLMPGAQMEGSITGTAGILRATNNGDGAALVGLANSAAGTTYGVLGNAFSPNGYAVWGYGSNNATAVRGFAAGGGTGVWGSSEGWHGVFGESRDNVGVLGTSTNFDGVWGETEADNANGVVGFGKDPCPPGSPAICYTIHLRNATGVAGEAFANGTGIWGRSKDGNGAYGETSAAHTYNQAGVVGVSTGDGGIGVKGTANTGAGAYGVYGVSTAGYGVVGQSSTGYAGYFIGKVGITGADLAERFAAVDDQPIEPGTVVVVDEDQPGKIRASDHAYDSQVIGIISGAGGIHTALMLHQDDALQGDLVVAIAGRVYCKAEANSAPVKPGDLLTTSNVKGYCMKATDRDQAYGAVIGKALTGLDKGEGLVLVLVNLQ